MKTVVNSQDLVTDNPANARDRLADLITVWRLRRKNPEAVLPPYQLPPNPYPGLRSFEPSESLLYFGRQGEDEALARRLETYNVVGVLGGSGSGKSSLVLAGLLPYLKRFQRIPGRGGRWYLVNARPGKDPVKAIIDAIWEAVFAPLSNRKFGTRALVATFASTEIERDLVGDELFAACRSAFTRYLTTADGKLDHRRLLKFAKEDLQTLDSVSSGDVQIGPANLLVVIDQFEEIFRKEVKPGGANSVVELVKAVHRAERQGLFITFTMRSEEMHRCAEFEGLSAVIFASSMQVELLTSEDDIHAIIVQPARRVFDSWGILDEGVGYDGPNSPLSQDLVNFLTEEGQKLSRSLDHKPDSLPLLQHALHVAWNNAVARWERTFKTATGGFRPELTLEDFPYKSSSTPLQTCLNLCADEVRKEAVGKIAANIDGDVDTRQQAASNLVDMALIGLARMDDNNRWVRRLASADEIAEESILEIPRRSKEGFLDRALFPHWRSPGYFEPDVDKQALLEMALDVFRRNGYLFYRDKNYDVSHEALIRSWSYYQLILQQAKSTRKGLIDADDALANAVYPGNRSDLARVVSWFSGGKAKRAWDAMRRVNMKDLEGLFVSPRSLGDMWARNQLVDEWKRSVQDGESSNPDWDSDEATKALQQEATAKVSRIRELFLLARSWSTWRGRVPPIHLQRVVAISSIPFLVIFFVASLIASVIFTSRLVDFLKDISSITDSYARNEPVKARNKLLPLLSQARDLSDSSSFQQAVSPITGQFNDKDPLDSATEILAQKARYILTFAPGKISGDSLVNLYRTKTDMTCGAAKNSPVATVMEFELRSFATNGPPRYAFFPLKPANEPISVSAAYFDTADTICVARDGSILLRIQANGLILYPLTLVTLPNGSRAIQFNDPVPVTLYDVSGLRAEGQFNNKVMSYLNSEVRDRGIVAFTTDTVLGLTIPLQESIKGGKVHRLSLYASLVLGINQPLQDTTRQACSKNTRGIKGFECKPVNAGRYEKARLLERPYMLKIDIFRKDGACMYDDVSCPQHLVLYQDGAAGGTTVRVFEQTHVGLPVVNAAVDTQGYLLLLDTAGNVWKYIVGWSAFLNATLEAGALAFESSDAGAAKNANDPDEN